jgi:hypothetical protein
VSVNRSTPVGAAQKSGPSGSAYVTFFRPEDALRCIESVDGAMWEGEQGARGPWVCVYLGGGCAGCSYVFIISEFAQHCHTI